MDARKATRLDWNGSFTGSIEDNMFEVQLSWGSCFLHDPISLYTTPGFVYPIVMPFVRCINDEPRSWNI